ncbi:uncharacterized protein N7446_007658 [Penicillium canescens]|uniref:Endosomal sorting complex protein TSG101 n=1 Tax=Penicillium canescens TaxID=5083 RepID=A0AAD6ILR7_PENCN|nr:uncharacterized protein N7446_007658 [Penicillium canescens]KAJ6034045.1 hypothetical protein N7444_011816 [Penicillium canescens]KAJ6056767.1 hypothetical protein N7460_000041 [Penicillium canescens]KAJ6058075.1 hypothetical protein N7446_007658 [Penicillium canescens]
MAVPQRTLNWLYSVLTKDHYDPQQTYQDPNRTYHDVANALAQYPSLSPRTDVYTYETGFSALLLHLVGTLPVTFRGTTYRFPIALWIPNTYPREPPIAYVTPTQDMAVRVGQHVTLEGQVYHHYLAHWAEAWDRSNIADLLSILQDVFAKEPPVRYRQPPQSQPVQAHTQTPPPLPPLPPGVGSSATNVQPQRAQTVSQTPPPPPPKPGATGENRQPQPSQLDDRYRSPPPPPKEQDPRQAALSHQTPSLGARPHQYYPPPGPPGPMSPPQTQGVTPYYRNSGVPPHVSANVPGQSSPRAYQPRPQLPQSQVPQAQTPIQALAPGYQGQGYPPQPHQQQAGPPYPQHSPYPSNYPHPPPAAPAPKAQTQDLLTSPFEVELPSIAPTGPAPPIPPNPEKDALLHAVSQSLAEILRNNAAQSDTAAQSLVSQSRSLQAAMATLQGEVSNLNALHATLQSNTTVLQQSIHRADATIADAQARSTSVQNSGAPSASTAPSDTPAGLPPIDDILVAPTVVGKQLYDLVAEEQGIQQALYALQAALVRGVIGVDSWSRHTRSLSREALLKRALIRKIGRGMGLEESVV